MNIRLDCEGSARIKTASEDRKYVCPYSGEFVEEGDICLVIKEYLDQSDEGVWFLLKYLDEFIDDLEYHFDRSVNHKEHRYNVFKMTESVRFGVWDQGQDCIVCGEEVGDEKSIYFLGLSQEGFEFIHHSEECVNKFSDLVDSIQQHSPQICSREL